MKKSAKITYIALRVMMGLIFVLAGVGFFLNDDASIKSNYLFICGQCALFLVVSFTPLFLKKLDLDIPDFVYIIFILFCMAHFFLGEILGFFALIKWWDALLHTFSGMLITLLSFSVINLLNKANGDGFKLNIGFACLFAFSIAITIGVVWEIVEFVADSWFGLNMQRAYESTVSGARGEAFVGQGALKDTMKDLILDALGAIIVCTACSIFVVKKGVGVEKLSLIKRRKKKDKKEDVQPENVVVAEETSQRESVLAPETSKTDNIEAKEVEENKD